MDGSPVKYANWAKAEPNNATGSDTAVVIGLSRRCQIWSDRSPSSEHAFVCEWDG